ncbi:MAG: hypothetical protein HY900_17865 [Deltaproteobacteria bacterium]|nr:hypothetical protein [Deltaproteobacteria bacterium]
MTAQSRSSEIVAQPDRCAGCLTCQMRCSYRFTGTFNLSQSRVEILRQPDPGGRREFTIAFREGCDGCGLCAAHCRYGALARGRVS